MITTKNTSLEDPSGCNLILQPMSLHLITGNRIANLTYDPNGNILTMQRYDSNGMKKHDFSYRYEYMQDTPKYNNRLKSVNGYVDAYTYNTLSGR